MKQSPSLIAHLVLLAICWFALAGESRGQVATILHSFGDASVTNDGHTPLGPLTLGTDGNFYGTTSTGGSSAKGSVFEMTPSGTVTILHSFGDGSVTNDGANPNAGLVQGLDGNFYGTTEAGGGSAGQGCVFKITPAKVVTILHSFGDGSVTNDGANPVAGLIQGGDGNFYGTTENGGGSANMGCVFEITPAKVVTILHSFGDGSVTNDGANPVVGVIQGGDGNFYGTTENGGGSANMGCVFEITPGKVVTILHSFGDGSVTNDGASPKAALVQGFDGNFYGTTSSGGGTMDSGATTTGCIFEVTPGKVLTILHSFGEGIAVNDGSVPTGALVQGADGNFYGTTSAGGMVSGHGCVFELMPQQQYAILHSFGDGSVPNDGTSPVAGLVQKADGNFYGMTQTGGANGFGTVFSMQPPTPFLTSAATASGSVSIPFNYQVIATNTPTNYAAANLPAGLSINAVTGLISGTPTTVQTKAVTLTLMNASGTSTFPVTITIGAFPVPVITSALIEFGSVGTAFSYSTIATNSATTYSATGLTSSGLSIDPSTGIISGSPTTATTYSVTLTATNTSGTSVPVILSIHILASPPMLTQEYYLVHQFGDGTVTSDGYFPESIIQGFDGNFYGVTNQGGSIFSGEVFKMTPQGVVSSFFPFDYRSNVLNPINLIQGSDGYFYGCTVENQIFKLSPSGRLTVLHSFPVTGSTNGALDDGLIQGTDGNFYGTESFNHGTGFGTVFKMTPLGNVTILHTFSVNNAPFDNTIIQGSDGNFYGTSSGDGTNSNGTVFKLTPQGTYTVLHMFGDGSVSQDGDSPSASLVEGTDGNFYGTTSYGGFIGYGCVFKITPQGTVTILHRFGDGSVVNDGTSPDDAPLIQGYDGNFYGTTQLGGSTANLANNQLGNGVIYQITPQGAVTILHNFGDGTVPTDASGSYRLIQGNNGNFYGTSGGGGSGDGGTIFSIVARQTPTHVPIYFGPSSSESALLNPSSFTPRAKFGISGTGAAFAGDSVQAQPADNGFEATLALVLPQSITKFFSVTNWTLTGTLPNYLMFDSTSGTISGTPVQGGIYTLTMTPNNAIGSGTPTTVTFYIDVPPMITSSTTAGCTVGTSFNYQIATANTADAYAATELPNWLSVDPSSGIVSGIPPAAGTYVFNIVALNVAGQSSQKIVLTATGGPPSVPAITSATSASVAVGTPYTYQIAATPGATSYTALALPTGLLFDAPSGTIIGTPSVGGTFPIPLTATNAAGAYASVLSLTISSPTAPVINGPLSAGAVKGTAFTYQIPATGTVNSYGETGSLPAGLSLNTMTGVVSGTPTVTGNFSISVTATNPVGTATAALSLSVTLGPPVTFSQWETANGINGGLTATPEHDGVPNLLKYLYDINPASPMTAAGRAALPTLGTATVGATQFLTLTYRQYGLETGLTINLQTCSDLKTNTWTTVTPDISQQSGTDATTGDPIMEIGVKAAGTRQFIRMDVTSP